MADQFVSKYSDIIHSIVWRFVSRNKGYFNSLVFDPDDLYQQCMSVILQRFLSSGKTVEEYHLSDIDVQHIMYQYVQSLLPVKTNRATGNYTQRMQKYRSQVFDSNKHDTRPDQSYVNPELRIDCDMFVSRLDGNQQKVFQMIVDGYTRAQIIHDLGITDMAFRVSQRKIARKLNRYLGQNHLYYGRLA